MSTDIQKIIKKILRGYKKLTAHEVGDIRPERDWTVLLILSLVLFIVSMGVNGVLFFKVYEGTSLDGIGAENTLSKDVQNIVEEVSNVEALFDTRKEKYESFISEPYSFVDPARQYR